MSGPFPNRRHVFVSSERFCIQVAGAALVLPELSGRREELKDRCVLLESDVAHERRARVSSGEICCKLVPARVEKELEAKPRMGVYPSWIIARFQ